MIKKRVYIFLIILFSIALFSGVFSSCGIEELFYLPQVPESSIQRISNNQAVIHIPNTLNSPDYDRLSPGYSIFYRIYISHLDSGSPLIDRNSINSILGSDFKHFDRYADPTNLNTFLNANSFRSRNYHELELAGVDLYTIITRGGGVFELHFRGLGESPVLIERNRINPSTGAPFEYYLFRNSGDGSNNGIIFTPEPNRFFFYSNDLWYLYNLNDRINIDTVRRPDNQFGEAYVSMYLVSVGTNPTTFSRNVFSKPTHIGVFLLPKLN
jgi:hypothetical protein